VVSGLQPNGTGSWAFKAGVAVANAVAWVNYTAVADGGVPGVTGFSSLSVSTNADYADVVQMYGAGWCEGYVTAGEVWAAWQVVVGAWFPQNFNTTELPEQYQAYMATQDAWVRANVASNSSALWTAMGYLVAQGDGMAAGYAAAAPTHPLPVYAFPVLSNQADLGDVAEAYPLPPSAAAAAGYRARARLHDAPSPAAFMRRVHGATHCSALIKVAPDLSDLWMGHSTWSNYINMLRTYKHYSFALQDGAAVGRDVSFSSYPGCLSSTDDWLNVWSSGLTVIETTNIVYNESLYAAVVPQSLWSWQRVRVASLLAPNPPAWAALFGQYNSGTYNNGYQVVHVGAFVPGAGLPADFIWEVEQVPGLVVGGDVTVQLAYGYFPSYNVPFWPSIYTISGYPTALADYGVAAPMTGVHYQLAPRAQIFRRNQTAAVDLASFVALMRYNDYLHDPLSGGDPWNAVCARGDLAAGDDAYYSGCYDTKATSASAWAARTAAIINGPTTSSGLPPFSWDAFPGVPHNGQPTLFNYSVALEAPSFVAPSSSSRLHGATALRRQH